MAMCIILEEKRDKRKSLAFQTMYKKKKGTDSPDGLMPNASPSTPIALSDNLSSVSEGKDSDSSEEKQEVGAESSATALQRMPRRSGTKGREVVDWGGAETSLAWDALVETAGGDAELAQALAEKRLAAAEKALAAAKKRNVDGDEDFEGYIAAFKEAERMVDVWKAIAGENARRAEAARIAELEAAEEERRLAATAEALENDIPEWQHDTPEKARARGARRHAGAIYHRQEPVEGVRGKEVGVKFTNNDIPAGRVMVIDASQLQPSHLQGERNHMFFIEEAQPKERTGQDSIGASRRIATEIRPEEITSTATAYTGAPVINSRGEVIQGNSRSDALRYLWSHALPEQQAKYKQYLIDRAADFELDAAAIAAMEHPVLVTMVDVADEEAIRLGQASSEDTESGGEMYLRPANIATRLGVRMREFAERLLRSDDDDASLGQMVSCNAADVLKWLAQHNIISPTQYKTAFNSKDAVTDRAKEDLLKTLYMVVFANGASQLSDAFGRLPVKAQRAILATAFRDMDSPEGAKMLAEIQASIMAYNELMSYPAFANAKTINDKDKKLIRAVEDFTLSTALDDRFETVAPAEKYSNFALRLAALYKASDISQKTLTEHFNRMYDLVQGVSESNLFEEADTTKYTLADAIRKVLELEYKPAKNGTKHGTDGNTSLAVSDNNGPAGQQRDGELPPAGERVAPSAEQTDRRGRTEKDSRGNETTHVADNIIVSRTLSGQEATELLAQMERLAEGASSLELKPENWLATFGEDGTVSTPIGVVKMGDNQYIKMVVRKRTEYFGMIYPTLNNPDIIIDKNAPADGDERDSKYIFVKTFIKPDGSRVVHFESITVRRDGLEVSVSSHEAEAKDIKKDMQNGKILHISEKLSLSSEGSLTETPNKEEGPDLVPTSDMISSDRKDNATSEEKQESEAESSEISARKMPTRCERKTHILQVGGVDTRRNSPVFSMQLRMREPRPICSPTPTARWKMTLPPGLSMPR